ncbi:MAG: hypothetical protein ACKV2U_28815 [Bryobacteraceae bacterium]
MNSLLSTAAVIALTAVAMGTCRAGTASGKLVIDGKVHSLNHAYAIVEKDSDDKTKEVLKLLISEGPISEAEVRSESKLMRRYFDAKFTYIEFQLRKGSDSSSHFLHSEDLQGTISGSNSPSLFKVSGWTDARIAGDAAKAEDDFGSTKTSFTVKVDAEIWKPVVVAPPTAAETASAVASEPAKAYAAYLVALRAGDKPLIRKGVVEEKAKMMDTPEFAQALQFIQKMMPQQVRVRKLVQTSTEENLLLVTGLDRGKQQKGEVTMVKEGGAWKVKNESWGGDW